MAYPSHIGFRVHKPMQTFPKCSKIVKFQIPIAKFLESCTQCTKHIQYKHIVLIMIIMTQIIIKVTNFLIVLKTFIKTGTIVYFGCLKSKAFKSYLCLNNKVLIAGTGTKIWHACFYIERFWLILIYNLIHSIFIKKVICLYQTANEK